MRLPTVQDFLEGRMPEAAQRPVYPGGAVILKLRSLNKAYRGKAVLSDFALELREGETLGLVGASGSGK